MDETIIVVGAGQAGSWSALTVRAEGFHGRVILIGEEPYPPYERPPLSKKLLVANEDFEHAFLHGKNHYADQRIELRLGCCVDRIDRTERQIRLSNSDVFSYDRLVITTGSKVKKIQLPGADLPGVYYLRNIEDSLAIRRSLTNEAHVVVIGGGYIGLEVAAAARARGCSVTVLESQDRVMNRVVAPEMSKFLTTLHRENGVNVHTNVECAEIRSKMNSGTDSAEGVTSADGTFFPADVVVIGIGVSPRDGLASAAGIACDDGIIVDGLGRTNDPNVFAAGDVARQLSSLYGRRIRLESWQNAQNQAIAVGKSLCGKGVPYDAVPWFWTDQFGINLQMIGIADGYDEIVIRGEFGSRSFTAFYLAGDRLLAANMVNTGREVWPTRQLIAERRIIDKHLLGDAGMPLREILKG